MVRLTLIDECFSAKGAAMTVQHNTERADHINRVFSAEFGELMARDPAAFERKFRKMAKNAFAFYRGSACLFYSDVDGLPDQFLDDKTSRVWIHGDKHAENFGTYMNSIGRFVFNVNDFDEAYVGPFTWDLKRFAASIKLLGVSKALSDAQITALITAYADGYTDEIRKIAAGGDDAVGELTLATTEGALHGVLQTARRNTRVALLHSRTVIENNDRRFAPADDAFPIDNAQRDKVEEAFGNYLSTLPATNDFTLESRRIKDVMMRKGMGIGSAGLPSYEILLEGATEALQDDVIVYMKEAQTPAVSRYIDDKKVRGYFEHQGHRTCESQRALQAHSDPWLGYTQLDGVGQMVAEVSPYAEDLDWDDVNNFDDMREVISELGQATARMHSVADDESSHDLVDFSTEEAITAVIEKDEPGFTESLVDFAHSYGDRATGDHALFVNLFRNGKLAL